MSFLTTIRVYNDEKDKRTFLRQVVHDFQVYEDLEDFIEAVLESTKKCFDEGRVDTIDDIDVGYVGSSNNKTYDTSRLRNRLTMLIPADFCINMTSWYYLSSKKRKRPLSSERFQICKVVRLSISADYISNFHLRSSWSHVTYNSFFFSTLSQIVTGR